MISFYCSLDMKFERSVPETTRNTRSRDREYGDSSVSDTQVRIQLIENRNDDFTSATRKLASPCEQCFESFHEIEYEVQFD